jgi:hypothetical protein
MGLEKAGNGNHGFPGCRRFRRVGTIGPAQRLSLAGSAEERMAVAFALRVGFGRRFGVKL